MILKPGHIDSYINEFNLLDDESVTQYLDNQSSLSWLKDNIPLLDCPDKSIERIYYFRWWTYRKHVKKTPDGFIITEFHPDVPWAGKHNSIVCPAGHHIYEGRWLRNAGYINDYANFWFKKGGALRSYSTWLVDAIWKHCQVTGDTGFAIELLSEFVKHYHEFEKTNLHESGLFWSNDDRDGGEHSISGSGLRPTLNSYMYGDAIAISEIAILAGQDHLAEAFSNKASILKALIQEKLWDESAGFFKVIPLESRDTPVENWEFDQMDPQHNVRELHGYIPWQFGIPESSCNQAWRQITDKQGFYAPFGPTTAEQRHPRYMYEMKTHQCLWNGPSWPFTTSFALNGMANVLREHDQAFVSRKDYLELLKIYANSHQYQKDDGSIVPWIDENLDPHTGEWRARSILEQWGWPAIKGGKERGKDYNHSTFCDHVISGLIGLKTTAENRIGIEPLIPDNEWDYFCLDNIRYHNKDITVLYDKNGTHYNKGKGLHLFIDNELVAHSRQLKALSAVIEQ